MKHFIDHPLQIYRLISPHCLCILHSFSNSGDTQISVYIYVPFGHAILSLKMGVRRPLAGCLCTKSNTWGKDVRLLSCYYRMRILFWSLKFLMLFGGMPDIPGLFWLTVNAGSKPTYQEKNESTSTP